MSTIGVIVNPLAGKDIRRLVSMASPVSDAAKIGAVRRAVSAALDAGATRVIVSGDHHQLGRRAVAGLAVDSIEILDEHLVGGRDDTVAATNAMEKAEAGAVVVFGGDGTHRDVASAWPTAPMIAVSTGTNNVYPRSWDATSAGAAAGAVASGAVALSAASRPSKLISVTVHTTGREIGRAVVHDVALVDVALVDGSFVGSRAVWDPRRVRAVLAAIATPASTGLSSIAGRSHPVDRWSPGGAEVRLGEGGRQLRIPLSPGSFTTVPIATSRDVEPGRVVEWHGPGVLALDGERTHVLGRHDRAELVIGGHGPAFIDVDRALAVAAQDRHFDVSSTLQEEPDVH